MFASRMLIAGLSMVVFACTALVAEAQTGPVGGGPKSNQPAPGGPGLTAEKVAVLLNSKVMAQPNGDKTISAMIEKDGWKFDITICFLAGGKVYDIYSALSAPNAQFTQSQLQGMEQKNQEWKSQQKAFILNPQDKRLYLADINFLTTVTEQQFTQSVHAFLATVRNSYDLWKSN